MINLTEEKKIEIQQSEEDWEDDFPSDEEMEITYKESIAQNIDCWGYYEFGHWNHDLHDHAESWKEYIWVLEKIAEYEGIKITQAEKLKFKILFKKHVFDLVKDYENKYDLDKVIEALAEAIHPILENKISKDKKFYRYL